jgi:hypothetical protein
MMDALVPAREAATKTAEGAGVCFCTCHSALVDVIQLLLARNI